MSQILIGYTTEGSTDIRFLESIIERTFIAVACECSQSIEVLTPMVQIKKIHGQSFTDQILHCSREALTNGVLAFCIHLDSDYANDSRVFENKIVPAIGTVNEHEGQICRNIVPLVPVRMTEAWMLADKELLKEEIGTNLSYETLGINRNPELFNDPKNQIIEAIRIARENLPRRRRKKLTISELYLPLGQKIEIDVLELLPSFLKFKEAVRSAYRFLNYLH